MRRIEAKLDRCRDLVDVLSTGAAGADEDLFDLSSIAMRSVIGIIATHLSP